MEGEGVDLPRSYTAWREGQERGKERMIRAQQLVVRVHRTDGKLLLCFSVLPSSRIVVRANDRARVL